MTFKEWLRWVFLRKTSQDAIVIDYNRILDLEVFVHEGHNVVFRGRTRDTQLNRGPWSDEEFRLTAVSMTRILREASAKPKPMMPKDIPQELVDHLDRRAGRKHSRDGKVLTVLAEVLTLYDFLKELQMLPSNSEDGGEGQE